MALKGVRADVDGENPHFDLVGVFVDLWVVI